jgi:hypothetical protein
MKRVLIALLLLMAVIGGLSGTTLRFAVGLDMAGETYGYEYPMFMGFKNETAPTASVQLELGKGKLNYGLGIDYQFNRETITPYPFVNEIEYQGFLPIYGILSYRFETVDKVSPELIGQLGYNIVDKNYNNNPYEYYSTKNGLFYGFGVGLNYDKFSFQCLYRVNGYQTIYQVLENNTFVEESRTDTRTSQINVSLGYRFDLERKY